MNGVVDLPLLQFLISPKVVLPAGALAFCTQYRKWWPLVYPYLFWRRIVVARCFGVLVYLTLVLAINFSNLRCWHHVSETIWPWLAGGAWDLEHSFACIAASFGAQAIRRIRFAYREHTVFLRGRKLIPYAEIYKKALKTISPGQPYLWWGMLPISPKEATKNFLIVGAPGYGKSLSIELALNCIVPEIRTDTDSRMVIYDAKSDMGPFIAARKGEGCPLETLDPFAAGCVAWDMAKDIRTPKDASEVVSALIPETNDQQPFFPNYTRLLFQGVMESFMLNSPGVWTLRDVLLAMKSPQRLQTVLCRNEHTKGIWDNLHEDRTRDNVLSTLEIERRRYSIIAAAWDRIWNDTSRRLSLNDWLKKPGILLLGQATAEGSPVRVLNQIVLHRLSEKIDTLPNSSTRRIWFILDELTDLHRVKGLELLLRRGRSKGVALMAGFQTDPGMEAVFGKERKQEITALFGYQSFVGMHDRATADWASSQFGQQELIEYRINKAEGAGGNIPGSTQSLHQNQISRPVVMAEQLLTILPTNEDNGLHAFHIHPLSGKGYETKTPMSWILEKLKAGVHTTTEELPPEVPCDPHGEYLREWSDEECATLKLPSVKKMDRQSPSASVTKGNSDSPSLKNISRLDLNS
jgi:hypothetical protein